MNSITFGIIAIALIYLVNPIDLIPDAIPFFGYMDDATIITGAIVACKLEINKF
jgi:uncharacterized membrane protein YkvA (DUF1232 family)